ncbi:MAG: uracil-DNA glycosylase [Desulfobacterales bacterium]
MVDARRLVQAIDEAACALRQLARGGTGRVDCSPETLAILAGWGRAPARAPESLEAIRAEIGDCRRCKLSESRSRIVFGQGNPRARLMFIGEGPGQEEDRAGEPFVGAAGQLLTRIILAMNLTREAVYIANVVKCRPPGNRVPEPGEIATCQPFLERQIAAIRPEFICVLGACAAQSLLRTAEPISRLRGRFSEFRGIQVMPTFHPAYLLRNPEKKREVWEDMKLLMKGYPYE